MNFISARSTDGGEIERQTGSRSLSIPVPNSLPSADSIPGCTSLKRTSRSILRLTVNNKRKLTARSYCKCGPGMRVNEGSSPSLVVPSRPRRHTLFLRSRVRRVLLTPANRGRRALATIVIITISRVPPRGRTMIHGSSSRAGPITFLRTALQRGRPPPRDYGYTRLPTLVPAIPKAGCGSRRRPDVHRHTGARFSLRTCTRCRVLPSLSTPLYLPFNLRLPTPLNQERSDPADSPANNRRARVLRGCRKYSDARRGG